MEAASERLMLALELSEAGLEMQRMNLRRASSQVREEELDELVREWLSRRPQAPFGDSAGVPGSLDRFYPHGP